MVDDLYLGTSVFDTSAENNEGTEVRTARGEVTRWSRQQKPAGAKNA